MSDSNTTASGRPLPTSVPPDYRGNTPLMVQYFATRAEHPVTILEDNMLDAKSNNYLVAAVVGDPMAGIGIVDVSTGELLTTEIQGDWRVDQLLDEIMRLEPAEILVPEGAEEEFVEAIRASCS